MAACRKLITSDRDNWRQWRKPSKSMYLKIAAENSISVGTEFGPFDKMKWSNLNQWMPLVKRACEKEKANLIATYKNGQMFYTATRTIKKSTEFCVWIDSQQLPINQVNPNEYDKIVYRLKQLSLNYDADESFAFDFQQSEKLQMFPDFRQLKQTTTSNNLTRGKILEENVPEKIPDICNKCCASDGCSNTCCIIECFNTECEDCCYCDCRDNVVRASLSEESKSFKEESCLTRNTEDNLDSSQNIITNHKQNNKNWFRDFFNISTLKDSNSVSVCQDNILSTKNCNHEPNSESANEDCSSSKTLKADSNYREKDCQDDILTGNYYSLVPNEFLITTLPNKMEAVIIARDKDFIRSIEDSSTFVIFHTANFISKENDTNLITNIPLPAFEGTLNKCYEISHTSIAHHSLEPEENFNQGHCDYLCNQNQNLDSQHLILDKKEIEFCPGLSDTKKSQILKADAKLQKLAAESQLIKVNDEAYIVKVINVDDRSDTDIVETKAVIDNLLDAVCGLEDCTHNANEERNSLFEKKKMINISEDMVEVEITRKVMYDNKIDCKLRKNCDGENVYGKCIVSQTSKKRLKKKKNKLCRSKIKLDKASLKHRLPNSKKEIVMMNDKKNQFFKCLQCERRFEYEESLAFHKCKKQKVVNDCKSVIPNFTCLKCGKRYQFQESLLFHQCIKRKCYAK